MSIRIGINPLTWTNDDMPELGANIPLDDCLAEGKRAGYAGFELGHKFPRDPDILARILARYDLALVSGWYGSRLLERPVDAEITAIQSHLSLLQAMNCEVMVVAEVSNCIHIDRDTPLSSRPHLDATRWDLLTSRLNELAHYCLKEGVQLAYHHHMGTVVQSAEDIDRLMDTTDDALGLLIDTGHLVFAGEDPIATARQHGKRVVHVHCKDVRSDVLERVIGCDSSFLDAVLEGVFTVPGDGSVDYLSFAEELKKFNYEGWLVVEAEQDPAIADPFTFAVAGYKHLKDVVTTAGLV